jgi:hypothetical protein
MRLHILSVTAIASIIAVVSLAVLVAGAGALGPTDNVTGQDFPSDNQTNSVIIPQFKYVMQGPSQQASATPSSLVIKLTGASGNAQQAFGPSDSWYLEVDTNVPGWIYMYEYFQQGSPAGQWLAYRWEMPQGGHWKFGPFNPGSSELEGTHAYRFWFYDGNSWVTQISGTQQGSITWTYSRPVVVTTPPPSPPVKEAPLIDRVFGFLTQPAALVFIPLILLIAILVSLIIYRRRAAAGSDAIDVTLLTGEDEETEPDSIASAVKEDEAVAVNAPRAKLSLPNGADIRFAGNKSIGRSELSRALEIDRLGLISRKHFAVSYKEDQYFIEDLGSANGTRLNGEDISGKGPVELKDNDVIEPAATLKIKFCLM